jgi:hypothetical protein
MFGKLFGGRKGARRGEDHVWNSDPARLAGMLRAVERAVGEGASVVVVAVAPAALDALAAGVRHHQPALCQDVFGQSVLRGRLAQAKAVTLALAVALPKPAPPADAGGQASAKLELLVLGRHDQRAKDDEIVAFADALGARASVTFHLSFDDPLLARFAGKDAMKELLAKLGQRDDEAIAHSMVTRSIERAQRT